MTEPPDRVSIEGPAIALKPEAAQNLGLALHELAINAAKFGALSVPAGRVTITWGRCDSADGKSIELDWQERLAPRSKLDAGRDSAAWLSSAISHVRLMLK